MMVTMVVVHCLILQIDLLIVWHKLRSFPQRILGIHGAAVVRIGIAILVDVGDVYKKENRKKQKFNYSYKTDVERNLWNHLIQLLLESEKFRGNTTYFR